MTLAARPGCRGTRSGFKTLIHEVGLGRVGIIISSEVSRLSRHLAEWGNLLEICRFTDTLIADAETLYSLRRTKDRFLLGILCHVASKIGGSAGSYLT